VAANYTRHEVALTVNADDLLAILKESPQAAIEAFGDEYSLRTALVRTASYDPVRHEILLVLEATGLDPVLRGAAVPVYFVRRKEQP
jgi:hypothetical protein